MKSLLDPVYMLYHLGKTDYRKLARYARYAAERTDRSVLSTLVDCLRCSWRHEMSPTDYFQLRMFERKGDEERSQWAGTTFMYKAQSRLNTGGSKRIFHDKRMFAEYFARFMDPRRIFVSVSGPTDSDRLAQWLLAEGLARFVTKPIDGQCGLGIEVHHVAGANGQPLIDGLAPAAFVERLDRVVVCEAFLENHEDIRRINPSCLNTLRVITLLDPSGEPRILAARMRFGLGGEVDNLAAGGIAAPVDLDTGAISGPAVSGSPTDENLYDRHPLSHQEILGFRIPHFEAARGLAVEAAGVVPSARSIGWDIAITQRGPVLIEGNHNWCKILWQLPVGRGLRSELGQHLLSASGA